MGLYVIYDCNYGISCSRTEGLHMYDYAWKQVSADSVLVHCSLLMSHNKQLVVFIVRQLQQMKAVHCTTMSVCYCYCAG